jgi:hypothetical protein
MNSGDCSKQEDGGDSLPSYSDLPKPIWVRYFGVQTDTINERLLEHNVFVVCFCGPIIWAILSIF